MPTNIELDNNLDNVFGVKHYKVKIIRQKDNPLKFIVSVISYAIFVFLLLVGGTLLLYVADIKIRAMKGDYSAPMFNAYVVLSGSMLPVIKINDVVVTKKVPEEDLEIGDIITFISPDDRFGGISITHRIIDRLYDEEQGIYTFKTQGDNNNVADGVPVPNANILGKVILKIPKLGYIHEILASKGGLIIFILIPSLGILSYDIVKMFRKFGKKSKLIKE